MTTEEVAAGLGKKLGIALNVVDDTFGSVYCECTFTVTDIGSGNPQISSTQISQTFNMD